MNVISYLIFSGCLCAGVFSVTLIFSRNNQFANRFLAAIIFAIGINLVISWIIAQSLFDRFPLLHLLPYGIGFGLGPLIYLYIKSLTTNSKMDYKHLMWIAGDYVHSIYHLIYGRSLQSSLFHEIADKLGALSILVITYYLWISRKVILTYQIELKQKLSNTEQQTLSWLNQFFTIFLILIPITVVFWILLFLTDLNINNQLTGPVIYLIVIFWLGIGGIRQPEIITRGIKSAGTEGPDKEFQDHLDLLIKSMERDKLYLLNDLNVRFLEEKLNLTAKQISEALNQGLGKNFYSFINEYRVREFKSRVAENHHLTFAGLAKDCGFNSKTTFQRVFKEITGMRPSEYLDSK